MKISFFVKTNQGFHILAKTESVEKALEITNNIKADGVMLDMDAAKSIFIKAIAPQQKSRQYVSSRTHQGIQRVPLDQIKYFQADQKYVTVHHEQGTLLIEDTLKTLELEFPQQFIRIHRNLLVNITMIESLNKAEDGHPWLKIRGHEERLPVSRRKLPDLRRRIK